jgi:hypothetical protein
MNLLQFINFNEFDNNHDINIPLVYDMKENFFISTDAQLNK